MSNVRPGRPKSQEKRSAILCSAGELFLKKGVIGTSMDEVARHSGVSKQTIYSHYKNKDALFSAVIAGKCDEYKVQPEHMTDLGGSLDSALRLIAEKFIALFHDEDVIAMYATVIGEARNTPRVAHLFYEAGPLASMQALANAITSITKGQINEHKAHLLAVDFFNLLKGEFHMRSLMCMPYRLGKLEKKEFIDSLVARTLCLHQHYYQ